MSNPEYFVVTDIHGCFKTLESLIAEMGVKDDDIIINCGDAVDRGPRIKQVLDFFMNRKNVINIIGNHDHMFMDYGMKGPTSYNRFMLSQGLQETLGQLGTERDKYVRFIATWEKYVSIPEYPEFIFCHATYPWQEGEDGRFTDMHMWDRWYYDARHEYESYEGPIIVHGHTPITNLSKKGIYENTSAGKLIGINLDGGCCYGGPTACLRGMRLSDRKIFEVKSLD